MFAKLPTSPRFNRRLEDSYCSASVVFEVPAMLIFQRMRAEVKGTSRGPNTKRFSRDSARRMVGEGSMG